MRVPAAKGLKDDWGQALTTGNSWAHCLTEPGAGSDAASLKTRAVRDGGDYLISGSKAFISGGGSSDLLIVMARTGGDGPRASARSRCRPMPGISYGRQEENGLAQPADLWHHLRQGARADIIARRGSQGFTFAMKGWMAAASISRPVRSAARRRR